MRRMLVTGGAALALFPAVASAHAELSPAVSLKGKLQLYSLTVPTEKDNATTTKVVLTLPAGFSIDSFAPSPGWHRVLARGGAVVSWTGGRVPTGEDALFQFLAQPALTGTYTFTVEQTYSDGSIVNWAGPDSSAAPAPTIEVKSSLGGGGGASALTIVALIIGVLGLLAGGFALLGASGRPLA